MFKAIPYLYKKETWPVFRKAFSIGYREKVFGAAILDFQGLSDKCEKTDFKLIAYRFQYL